jgi:Ca2+-transporting ATPase
VVCKGAPEALLADGLQDAGAELSARVAEIAEQWAREGLRVLAVACSDRSERSAGSGFDVDDAERGLRLLGLIGITDPPRRAAAGTIAACRRAGIRPVLITGDHPGTARAIAVELGIIEAGDAVVDCGAGLSGENALDAFDASVYARATPADKLAIVKALRERGETVAMTGDGVNDGPALRAADIGVAMGGRGTEVARQAADLVLADDDLDTVVAAVEEGRRVFANIRRFLIYGLSGGAAEITVMLLGPALGFPLFLLPAQILWINLLTHGLPGVALGGEPSEPGAMDRPPRPPSQSILAAGLWQRVVRISLVLSVVTLGVAVWADHAGRPWQSMAFFALGAAQLGVAIGSRSRPRTRANPLLPIAVAAALALQVAGLYLPALQDLLKTVPLSAAELLTVAALSVLGFAAIVADRRLHPGPP